jgi:hypothetical protein
MSKLLQHSGRLRVEIGILVINKKGKNNQKQSTKSIKIIDPLNVQDDSNLNIKYKWRCRTGRAE